MSVALLDVLRFSKLFLEENRSLHIKRKGGHYYTASFTITFPHDNDTVHLAYCYPYTYSDLQLYLKELEAEMAEQEAREAAKETKEPGAPSVPVDASLFLEGDDDLLGDLSDLSDDDRFHNGC